MLLTELNGPRSFPPRPARSRRFSSSFRLSLAATLVFTGLAVHVSSAFAQEQQEQQTQQDPGQQSVAEAARQERARKREQAPKHEQTKTAKHVYTEEDLKRSHILTPQDQAAVEARKTECAQNTKNNCAPAASQNPGALDANSQQPSLGEVARQYRKQKELQALQPKQSQPFHLSIGDSALASPIVPEHPALRPPAPPVLGSVVRNSETRAASPRASDSHTNISRRDPFAPVLTRPRVPFDGTSQLRSATRPSAKIISPVAPTISAAPMPSAKLFSQPIQPAPITAPPHKENSPRGSTFVFEPVRPSSQNKSSRTRNVGSLTQPTFSLTPHAPISVPQAQLARPALQLQPVRPIVPSKKLGRVSAIPSANIFRAPGPTSPLESAKIKPVAPLAPATSELPKSASTVEPRSAKPSSAIPVAPASVGKTIRVQPGDSLWKLARRNLGRGVLWTQLRAANPVIADPNRLPVGAELLLPNPAAVSSVLSGRAAQQDLKQAAQTGSFSTLQVRHGDTLWSLAGRFLGNPAAWPCLAGANPSIVDPNRIFAGQQLLLPDACQPKSRQ
jgi:nucleoid-associated protein YgaU